MEQERISNLIKESEQTIQHQERIITLHTERLKELGYIVLPPCAECGRTLFLIVSATDPTPFGEVEQRVRCECGVTFLRYLKEESK
jgi:hypothetical protein